MIRLSELQRQAVRDHGAREFPYECCGVLLGDVEDEIKKVREVRPLPNVHEEGRQRRYLVAPDLLFRLMQEERRTKRKILGFYHSHPNHPAYPSGYDREWASPWYTYVIVSVVQGVPTEMTAWRVADADSPFEAEEIGE